MSLSRKKAGEENQNKREPNGKIKDSERDDIKNKSRVQQQRTTQEEKEEHHRVNDTFKNKTRGLWTLALCLTTAVGMTRSNFLQT